MTLGLFYLAFLSVTVILCISGRGGGMHSTECHSCF